MQNEDEQTPAAIGEPAGDLKIFATYNPTGHHTTLHWKRAVIGMPRPRDRGTLVIARAPSADRVGVACAPSCAGARLSRRQQPL